jgi:hypothetical protein
MNGDRAVWTGCVFAAGILLGMWLEPKFAACVEIPAKPASYPKTKAEMQGLVKAYHDQGKGYIK